MRRGIALLAMLALAACIPRGERAARAAARRDAGRAPSATAPTRCNAMSISPASGSRFRALPDQRFAGGCSALGAVQLLDIGTPVTNLGAMTCPLARQFARWAREAVQPAADQWLGSRCVRIETFGTYACRTVNSQPGARLTEHAFANAVDVSAFVLADGRRITVQDGWNGDDERVRRFLRAGPPGRLPALRVGLWPDCRRLSPQPYAFRHGPRPLLPLDAPRLAAKSRADDRPRYPPSASSSRPARKPRPPRRPTLEPADRWTPPTGSPSRTWTSCCARICGRSASSSNC